MNRAIDEKDLTQEVALYTNQHGSISIWEWEPDGFWERSLDYVCVSEPVTVTFKPLPDDDVLKGRVAGIDAEIEKTRAEMNRKINDLTDQKNRLLAITHEPVE